MAKSKAKTVAKKALKAAQRTEPVRPTGAAELLKELDARAGVTGGAWKGVVVGDTIVGELLAVKREDSKYRDGQLTLTVATDDGTQTVWANWSMESALLNIGANIGDRIGLQYKGDVPSGRGRPMKTYAAVREGGRGTPHPLLTPQSEPVKKGTARKRKS